MVVPPGAKKKGSLGYHGAMDIADLARRLALSLVPMLLSLTVHELAHAFVAYRLGDDTAKREGRLTLNPLAHADPFGTFIIPALSVLMGGVAFLGWAKPVPVRPARFHPKVPRRLGMAAVAAAGPLSNLLIALACGAALAALTRAGVPLEQVTDSGKVRPNALGLLLQATLTLNVGLCVFNFLPIPPLDGHRLLPPVLDRVVKPLERYGFAVLMGIFMFLPGVANVIFYRPVGFLTEVVRGVFGV